MAIMNNNTHIAHGLNPSTVPITAAIIGSDTVFTSISPRKGSTNFDPVSASTTIGFSSL
ncbi:hypothetical protein D3C80_1646820 [compost metagenome]